MHTRQELFNMAYIGLTSQMWNQSFVQGQGCSYRDHENGLKCAVGHMIPDDRYDSAFEGSTVRFGSMSEEIRKAAGISDEDSKFAAKMQSIHDDVYTTPLQMKERFETLAVQYDLKIPRKRA